MSGQRSPGTTTARGREPNQMPSALVNAGGWDRWCTPGGGLQTSSTPGQWEPWDTPGGGGGTGSEVLPRGGIIENNGASSGSVMVYDLTVADENVLQCGVCFHPLKPPIFQCGVGHVLCSSCSNKLNNARKCHLCRVAMPGGYKRCHAMEDVVSAIRVPCPHAPYGCNTRPAYYDRDEHLLQCPHAPCHCPAGGDACSFVGPVAKLIQHLTAAHGWPCTNEVFAGAFFDVHLREGFNFVKAARGSAQYLFLLNMASTPFGHAISAVWIRSPATIAAMISSSSAPAAATRKNTTCDLDLTFMQCKHDVKLQKHQRHIQKSQFQVEGMCPSNGLPDPNTSFQFLVPKYAGGTKSNEAPVCYVTAAITIHSS